jgi:NAD(P)-dependent dehydrogenase (short-subunit alcohol dehydrogenase family)
MGHPAVFAPNNTAVITGGASGIGLALATKCAHYGMNVVICDNNPSNLEEAKKSIEKNGEGKGTVEIVEMDVGKLEDFTKVIVSSLYMDDHQGPKTPS